MTGWLSLQLQLSKYRKSFLQYLQENISHPNLPGAALRPHCIMGEAQGAESRADFIHKMKISVKELRETFHCLKIISKMNWNENIILNSQLSECNELISIFVKSIAAAQKNRDNSKI